MRLALTADMASRRAHPAAIAAASDGSVLINLVSLLPEVLQEQLSRTLGAPLFIGVPLSEREAGSVVARLDNAAAEASAQVLGSRPKKASKPAGAAARKRR
jgi:hypothetical protein